jgi:Flp pilus assembly protein TadD
MALFLLSWYQRTRGHSNYAMASGKRVVELAPLDYMSSFCLGVTYHNAREFDKAINQLRKTSEIDPGSPMAHSGRPS